MPPLIATALLLAASTAMAAATLPDPLTIFSHLRSADASQRRTAEQWLFGEPKGMEHPAQGSLSFANLDDDPQDEAILMLKVPTAQLAFVFDQARDGGWRKVGDFVTEVRIPRAPVIETRQAGAFTAILVRDHGWLSEGGRSTVTLYRLLRGSLKPILEFIEEEAHPLWGSDLKQNAWQSMYVLDNGSILLHGRRIRWGPMNASGVPELVAWDKGETMSCDVYSWDRRQEKLSRDPAQTRQECASILRNRRPSTPAR